MPTIELPHPKAAAVTKSGDADLLLLYGMTGFTGLLAEQALEKYITLLVGATATASAIVVFTYFLGFALGGVVAAQALKRNAAGRPLRTYGLLELLVGISCVVFSYTFHAAMARLAPLQNMVGTELAKEAVRFGCGCLLVLPIAALMGASFPLIAQALDRGDAPGAQRWSQAYSANLAGAVLASLLAPYFLIPAIGLRGVMWLCAGICGVVAIVSQLRRERSVHRNAPDRDRRFRAIEVDRNMTLLLAASFLSGWIFFALEIIWTHLIGAVIGGSVYAFSAMLATVLTGLLAGSWLVNRMGDRAGGVRTSFVIQLCAISLVIQLWIWDVSPAFFAVAGPRIYAHFYAREAYRLLVAAVLIVPPSTLLGMIYPRVLRSPLIRHDNSAFFAGYLSAANSLGCLLGAVFATFVLVPMLGSELSLKFIIVILAALSLCFRLQESDAGASPRLVAVLGLAMVLVATVPRHWEWKYLTSGMATYFGEAAQESVSSAAPGGAGTTQVERSIIFRDEDIQGGFTTIVEQKSRDGLSGPAYRYMYTNGKFQGDNDPNGESRVQFGVAAVPSLFTKHFDRALLIGLGTGHSASVLKQLGFKKLDIAELAPGVVRAAEAGFSELNHHVLSDPTVKCSLEDGRNLLLTEPDRRYDVITILLSAIWFSGATNLYSKEFFELAQARLEPDGILQQWVQLHRIGPEEIASVIATARSVFPYVSYWAYGGQGMVIAANHPITVTPERRAYLQSRLIESGHLALEQAQSLVEELSQGELLSQAGVDAMVRELKPVINTDHNRHIEYATPRYSSAERDWRAYNLAFLKHWNQ